MDWVNRLLVGGSEWTPVFLYFYSATAGVLFAVTYYALLMFFVVQIWRHIWRVYDRVVDLIRVVRDREIPQ